MLRPTLVLVLALTLTAGCAGTASRERRQPPADPRVETLREQLEETRKAALETLERLRTTREEKQNLAESLLAAQKEQADALATIAELRTEKFAAEAKLADLRREYSRLEAEMAERDEHAPEAAARGPVKMTVSFVLGGIEIDEEQKAAIEQLGRKLAEQEGTVYIDGHSDNVPITSEEAKERYGDNLGLSMARSSAVARILTEAGGLPAGRLVVRGFGDAQPVASNQTAEGRAENRRVEIRHAADADGPQPDEPDDESS